MNLPHVYAFALSAVGLVGIIVLSALHVPVPAILSELTVGSLTAGAGLAMPASAPKAP